MAGQVVVEPDTQGIKFYVVVQGKLEIIGLNENREQTYVVCDPGMFTGELNMLSGRRSLVKIRVSEAGELIEIAGGFHSAREFLDHAALATSREREGDDDVVSLMTLHKAKGLEFPHVFLPAFEAGIIPSSYGDVDEERRLAYVALTRGMRQVRISWALYRRGPTEPSPFVDAIPERSRVFLSRLDPKQLSPQARAGLRHIAGRLRRHG